MRSARQHDRVRRTRRGALTLFAGITVVLITGGCSGPAKESGIPDRHGDRSRPRGDESVGAPLTGKATWYGGKHHGGPTASGERFNKNAMTAAHRKLPFGTRVRVTNRNNGRSVVVRINDRGPFGKRDRIIDLSEAAARKIEMIGAGVVPVTVEILEIPPARARNSKRRRR